MERGKVVIFEDCILEDFGRRGPEVQSCMWIILRRCLIRNWGEPGRFDVRAFAAWAHHGGLLRPAAWLPGVCRGLIATAGGHVRAEDCRATRWWIRLEERHGDMSQEDAAEMVRRLEAMRQDMERR